MGFTTSLKERSFTSHCFIPRARADVAGKCGRCNGARSANFAVWSFLPPDGSADAFSNAINKFNFPIPAVKACGAAVIFLYTGHDFAAIEERDCPSRS